MTPKALQYKQLIRQYDEKRNRAIHDKKVREQEIYEKIPRIEAIDTELAKTGISLVRQMLNTPSTEGIPSFRENSKELQTTKKMLLVEHGYPEDYLEPHFECSICDDTGFIGNEPCKCFKQNLINMAYAQSNLSNILELENFSSFSFEFYSPEVPEGAKRSVRQNMQNIYEASVDFIENFDHATDNLLFYGPTGLGKTFLCNCIAKELLDSGHTVLYLSAMNLFKLFNEARFHRADMPESAKEILNTLDTVDLLIIDDLGTESGTSLTAPDFFSVLNNRYLAQKSTIISSNLKPSEWKKLYSERVISRIWGHYTTFRLYGEDIRIIKKHGKRVHRT